MPAGYYPANQAPTRPHRHLRTLENKEHLKKELFKNIKIDHETGCHNWQMGVSDKKKPYGVFRVAGEKFKTHRLSAYVHLGYDIRDKKMNICHTCDNHRCINPAHLFIGTPKENAQDAENKKRLYHPYGEKNHFSKFTAENVLYIRANPDNKKVTELAKMFNVSIQAVYFVIKRKVWKHI